MTDFEDALVAAINRLAAAFELDAAAHEENNAIGMRAVAVHEAQLAITKEARDHAFERDAVAEAAHKRQEARDVRQQEQQERILREQAATLKRMAGPKEPHLADEDEDEDNG